MARYQPAIGEWYQTPEDDLFEVVAYDPEGDTIEIQHADGALEELDLDTWNQLALIPAGPPEDWTGPLDVAPEDLDDLEEHQQTRRPEGYDYLNDIDRLS